MSKPAPAPTWQVYLQPRLRHLQIEVHGYTVYVHCRECLKLLVAECNFLGELGEPEATIRWKERPS